ncbi:MAG: hypothetical protein HOM52_12965 [Rhodospirillaceae bacterium]|jgi:protein tyrosine phosphatase (PTP) superfamily phosphohydrolase (DUF442 family)|nr:hypothetical protein [Rhodospirillaceae bacterium]MBT4427236.1 hypothetical protein [Rhodospirillaceae bacterium]MBT5039416.1 hypothetical protein [Rhodospirillaceae bacterium]MBT7292971.1 hypothetical protein [Rhodospirillaceae bacterium]
MSNGDRRRFSLNAFIHRNPKRFRLMSAAAVVIAVALLLPGKSAGEAPFADALGSLVEHYDRRTPAIASSGEIRENAYGRLAELGFESILDLRVPEEGAEKEKLDVEARGMRYFNIPMGYAIPSEEEIAQFKRIVEDAENLPLLFHGVFANRAGSMWALYRARGGIPVEQAYEEGRTAGLKGRRATAVREALGLE